MFGGLFIVSLFFSCYQAIKESFAPTISAEQWGNKELIHKDIMDGNSSMLIKNAKGGKYITTEKYSEPHRDKDGKIVIENYDLWKKDVFEHGAYQTSKWVAQGKYNLSPDELKKKDEEVKRKLKYLSRM